MPPQQRLRRHQKHHPAIPRQQPARSGKEQPVAPPKRRPLHRPPKDTQLVAEHRILDFQLGDRRASGEDAHQPPHQQVNQEEQHQTILRNTRSGVQIRVSVPFTIPASSGQTTRHRLSRGGDRQLNRALHTVILHRRLHDPATKDYIARRIAEGKTTRDAVRMLKRYLARHLYRLLQNQEPLMT